MSLQEIIPHYAKLMSVISGLGGPTDRKSRAVLRALRADPVQSSLVYTAV